ncbi:phosphate/phosphite/phosphonate ABC transporter substrate-binding protein [Loigolactobacillus iwatensis]|uniref:phosphate/phosphite/phosphonate ABC transporter substrate-binding protein n=1 Tax=Loigolactobacillus iwatensis TaxID=1267156 RepID=UPI000F7DB985|nr:PhnD/SsuA/transferrin family substrate-binding protein [Loigolactobacillus iwatensis]
MSTDVIRVGAVIYNPKVTVIWGVISDFLAAHGAKTECKFYKNYDMQVTAMMNGEIDVAWNSPLAWLDTYLRSDGKCLHGVMRDTDQNRKSYFVARKADHYSNTLALKGKKIGFGAIDSPQARLIPILHLHTRGLEYQKDYIEQRFDVGVGLQGDHIGGELDAINALKDGKVDAAVTLDKNWDNWSVDGTIDPDQLEVIEQTRVFDHCIFTGRPGLDFGLFEKWNTILMEMDYNDPEQKKVMDMEGLQEWVPGRLSGYRQIQQANKYLHYFD